MIFVIAPIIASIALVLLSRWLLRASADMEVESKMMRCVVRINDVRRRLDLHDERVGGDTTADPLSVEMSLNCAESDLDDAERFWDHSRAQSVDRLFESAERSITEAENTMTTMERQYGYQYVGTQ